MRIGPRDFKHVTAIDFEFQAQAGENPKLICLVARDVETGATQRIWKDDLSGMKTAPYPTGPNDLTVAFYASAELGCFLQLGWPFPSYVLDLFAEFRCLTNNKPTSGNGLLDALSWYGLDGIEHAEKKEMRELAMRGGPYSTQERIGLLDYCESDVIATQKLLLKMLPNIDLLRALLRGRYMGAVARIESNGIPVDAPLLRELESCWPDIQGRLIEKVDAPFRVFDGLTFKMDRFSRYLIENNIAWQHLESGKLDLKEQTFEEMAKAHPQLTPLHEVRVALAQMRLGKLPVGADGRNRTLLSPFQSVTGRNQPRTKGFIFGRSAWFRHLIQPQPNMALAYVDWSQQEFGIAGALSTDPAMIAAYASGDPYLEFGKQAGVIPSTGTKKTHAQQREQFKQCALAVLYGGGARLVALRTGLSLLEAKALIQAHKKSYPVFWKWIGGAVDCVNLGGSLQTVFGWRYHAGPKTKPGTLLNFPMQANGADMMRLAACRLVEAGIRVCAPVHDAFLIEAEESEIDAAISSTQRIMEETSRIVLSGNLALRSDAKVIRHPERYVDERGEKMWETIQDILSELRAKRDARGCAPHPSIHAQDLLDGRTPVPSPSLSPLGESP
jgi:hypothetical protein